MSRTPFHARVVLFDWDGTILDSYAADQRAYLSMFRALGIAWGAAEIDRNYSPDWYRVYRAARIPKSDWERADRLWRTAYRAERPGLLAGARTTLRILARRFELGIVTAGSRGTLDCATTFRRVSSVRTPLARSHTRPRSSWRCRGCAPSPRSASTLAMHPPTLKWHAGPGWLRSAYSVPSPWRRKFARHGRTYCSVPSGSFPGTCGPRISYGA
jgi:hypothetical protein